MLKENTVLYLMGIGWGWIKQRPHFIAEGLAEKYNVVTLSKKSIAQRGDVNKTNVHVVYPVRLFPERVALIKYINTAIYKIYLRSYLKRCKYIWFCSPNEFSEYVLQKCNDNHVIIYDCMDDMMAFPSQLRNQQKMLKREGSLVRRSNIIFCSAMHLKNTIKNRYQTDKEIILLNNALTIDENSYVDHDEAVKHFPQFFSSNSFKVTYIGTIAEWFDFELVSQILKEMPEAEIHLFGPCSKALRESHQIERMVYHGPVDHKYVKAIMQGSSALIMPFVLNNLILSVNPVKLYEYIFSGIPCLAPLYGESKPFEDYCYLYHDTEDCIQELKRIENHQGLVKQSIDSCISFAKENTWRKRMEIVLNYVEKY